ncbi:kinesin light chain [Achaetomium macrosporum]|uniref:Kinesin light chain n=1 Tax=Achaetomium macrosporum TaxID=79813 RepID=A0AAN7HB93_9PEZI|nr:kinesin light chain [Achaetomium macrosporum]
MTQAGPHVEQRFGSAEAFQGGFLFQGYVSGPLHIHQRPETPPAPFATIPFSPDPDFVSRGDILDRMDKRCSEPAARVALVGLSGVGKSQLAIEYAHRIATGQPDRWVFWVRAGTQARVEESFRTIANAVKLPGRNQPKADIPQLVYGWLSNERNGRWMMILDSADDLDVFYNPTSDEAPNRRPFAIYLPQSRNGSIIITTQRKDLAFRLTGRYQNIIEVGPMPQTDALMLLEKKLGSLPDTDVAADLVEALDFFPLAINQAAAYIQARAPRSSPEKYLAEFRKSERKRSRLLQYDAGDLRRDGGAPNAILKTWQISFDHIRSKRPSAADLLALMSFFDRQCIPGWVLNPSGIAKDAVQARGDSAIDDADDADGEFEDDITMLRNYCLIATDEAGKQFEMHGLVQLATKTWLETYGQQETFEQQCVERLADSFPTGEYEDWAKCRSLFAHVQVALRYRPSENTAETWAKLLHNGGWYAWSQGRYDIAEQMLGKAEKTCEKMLGKENFATLSCMLMFAIVLTAQGRWEEAEKRFAQAMDTFETKFGVSHPYTLGIIGNLASTFLDQGRLEEAEKLLVQLVEASQIKHGVDHRDTLKSMANLASTYSDQGRWEEAEKLEVQVLEANKIKFGVDHPDTLRSMSNLASTYLKQGRLDEAEELFVLVMEGFEAEFGVDHPFTLLSMCNLASAYLRQGRQEEAQKLIIQIRERGKTNQGRHTDALLYHLEDCAEARERILDAKHPVTLLSFATTADAQLASALID